MEAFLISTGLVAVAEIGDKTQLLAIVLAAKFRKPVVPGDTIEYHMRKINSRRNMWWFRGEAKVDGVLVAEAEVGAMLVAE